MPHTETSGAIRKITVEVPAELLSDAQEETGEGITQTVAAGLEKLRRSCVYKKALELKGTCDLKIDIDASREDRVFE